MVFVGPHMGGLRYGPHPFVLLVRLEVWAPSSYLLYGGRWVKDSRSGVHTKVPCSGLYTS